MAAMRRFTCARQFRAMLFAQLTWCGILRDIEVCLAANPSRLYAMGFCQPAWRSTSADASENRDWRMWAEVAEALIRWAHKFYCGKNFGLSLDHTVHVLDSTTTDVYLSLFDWVSFRTTKAAVKIHTPRDLRGSIPAFIYISDRKMYDVWTLDLNPIGAGAFYVMDRGQLDYHRTYDINRQGAFYATRAKRGVHGRCV